jgi:hypothetical protein
MSCFGCWRRAKKILMAQEGLGNVRIEQAAS